PNRKPAAEPPAPPPAIIYFYNQNNTWGEFSNFYPAPIRLNGKVWPTSEHYFQAMKFEPYEEVVEKVRLCTSPSEAARTGRSRSLPLRPDWEQVKESIMMRALIAKFTQHPNLAQVLLSTGQAILVEHTSNDSYWADGWKKKGVKPQPGEVSPGRNRLGVLLMKMRDMLLKEEVVVRGAIPVDG
ncbi:hypothetical protein HK102_013240, partial [Quaeritorhiza haematococci]